MRFVRNFSRISDTTERPVIQYRPSTESEENAMFRYRFLMSENCGNLRT